MPKLTLSVDAGVVQGAKRYARRRGTSVSKLVEDMLRMAAAMPGTQAVREAAEPPVLAKLRGSLKQADERAYKRHLAHKYR